MSKISNEASAKTAELSFVDSSKDKKRFDQKAYAEFTNGLAFRAFLNTQYNDSTSPVAFALDTPHPMRGSFFNTEYLDTYAYVSLRFYDNSGFARVYMKDLDTVIDALDKIRHGYKAMVAAGERDFPKPVGYDEWQAANGSNGEDCVQACCG